MPHPVWQTGEGLPMLKVMLLPSHGDRNPYLRLLARALEAEGVRVYLGELHRFATLWRAVLKHGKPDLIHLQWQHAFFTGRSLPVAMVRTSGFFLQWLTLRLMGVRFVWTVHNVVSHERQQSTWELRSCRFLARVVDCMVVHCAAAVPTVAAAYQVGAEQMTVVPHGHYGDVYPAPLAKGEARRILDLPDSSLVFLYFGLVREYKGLDRLLEAFARLEAGNVRLILAGQALRDSLRQALTSQASADPRVEARFEFLPEDLLVTYLSACDLVVLPYEDLLTSGSAILAAQCARPILAPCAGCLREFPAEASILYDVEAQGALALALEQALTAPLERMGLAARKYVEQFPWSLSAARLLAVYESVLSRRGRGRAQAADAPGDGESR